MPGWLRTSVILAAVTCCALLLWVGFALFVAALLIVAIPFSIWSVFARRSTRGRPVVVVEGSATRVHETAALEPASEDKARTGSGPRDA